MGRCCISSGRSYEYVSHQVQNPSWAFLFLSNKKLAPPVVEEMQVKNQDMASEDILMLRYAGVSARRLAAVCHLTSQCSLISITITITIIANCVCNVAPGQVWLQMCSGCSTAAANDREVVGSNPTRCWDFLFIGEAS